LHRDPGRRPLGPGPGGRNRASGGVPRDRGRSGGGALGAPGPRDRLDGVARVIYGAALGRPLVGLRDALGIFIRSTVTIGTGGSAGREGPVVIIGAGLAGTLGRLMKLSGREMRTLLAAGVAAGVAVAFNAPVAGSLF